jgi:Protein of unknown function (DUF3224)
MSGRTKVLTLFAVLAVALGASPGAVASPPTEASGTFTYTSSTFNSIREAGGNLIIDLSATVSYTGTFTGTSTVHGTLIFHANGRANFHDVEVFTGTVNGVPGTVTFNLSGSNDPALNLKATNAIVSATGELAGLHGVLSMSGSVQIPVGPFGTYSGQIQFGSP